MTDSNDQQDDGNADARRTASEIDFPPSGAERPLREAPASAAGEETTDQDIASDDDWPLAVSESYEDKLFEIPCSDRVKLGESHDDVGSKIDIGTNERNLVKCLRHAARTIRALSKETLPVFRLVQVGRLQPKARKLEKVGVAKEVFRMLRDIRPYEIEYYFPDHQLNPYLDILFDLLEERPKLRCVASNWDHAEDDLAQVLLDELDGMAEEIRKRTATRAFRRQFNCHRRRCDHNAKSLRDYIHALLRERGSRLLVVRLDLSYLIDALAHGTTDPYQPSEQDAREHLRKFVRHLRDSYALKGYAWRLERGVETGLHFHVLIFLDGHVHREGVELARMLGKHWNGVITKGYGCHHNCNAARYRHQGTGMVNYNDGDKRAALIEVVAPYLTKVDFWMYWRATGKTFSRGFDPKPKRNVGRAAPAC